MTAKNLDLGRSVHSKFAGKPPGMPPLPDSLSLCVSERNTARNCNTVIVERITVPAKRSNREACCLKAKPKRKPKVVRSLHKVLKQSKHVKVLLQESTDELSSVNASMKREVLKGDVTSQVENVLEKNEAAEVKVTDASDKLTAVNKALEGEIKERDSIDQQIVAVKQQEESARYAAFHDVLTGLPNRALFIDRLEHGLEQAARHGWTLAVMFIDLDQFKSVNDTHGHAAGDAVLRWVAQCLKDNTRADDTVSRYGGDEFLYLLTQFADDASVAMIAKKIILAITSPPGLADSDHITTASISASIGISIYPGDGTTADVLIKVADAAMYRAKQQKLGYAFSRADSPSV
jgi:diguanylate cyclase (GGDEF)-like protein